MMTLAINGYEWRYCFTFTGCDVVLTVVAAISKHTGWCAKFFWQVAYVLKSRHDLLLVIGLLGYMGCHNQFRFGINGCLGIVGLLKTTAGGWHDAGFFVRQVNLVFCRWAWCWRFGMFTSGLFAGISFFFITGGNLLVIC